MWHLYPSPHSNHRHISAAEDSGGTSQRLSGFSGGNKSSLALRLYGHMVCKNHKGLIVLVMIQMDISNDKFDGDSIVWNDH